MEDKKKVEMFYVELSALAAKYDMEGIVGLWFMADCDFWGTFIGAEIDNAQMQFVMGGLGQKLREFNQQIQPDKEDKDGDIKIITIKPRKSKL